MVSFTFILQFGVIIATLCNKMILHATGFFFFLDDIIHSIAVGCGLQQIQLSFPEKSIVQYKRYKKEQWVPFYISLSYMMAIPHMPDENCDAMSNKENPMSELLGLGSVVL